VFRRAMAELGHVEGKTIQYEARTAAGQVERLPGLVAGAIDSKVDVLVVVSTAAALAAKAATTSVPIVFASLFDPVGSGVVTNLARPGGNITGAAIGVGGSGLGGKWVELLKEAVPGMARLAVLANPVNPANMASVREIQAGAAALKVAVEIFDAGTGTELNRALVRIRASGAQGLIVTNDPFFTGSRDVLLRFAAAERLPAMYFFRHFVEAGGLMKYGASQEDSYRQAASYVDRILKGASPGDLPVVQPTRFELVINQKSARALGLVIPPSLLVRADDVIE